MNEFLRRLLFLPEQASTFAEDMDRLHYFVIIASFIGATAVALTAILFYVRFRRKSEDQTTPYIVPNGLVESAFIGVPLALFLLWFAIGYRDFVRHATPPPDAMDVYVMAKKWMWKFTWPDGPNAINVLRVPSGRPVRLLMTSQDVIHSFFVPEFRIKQDVNPGRYTQVWFEAKEPGRYPVLCTEYCGAGHSIMRGEVIVMKPEEYEDWLTSHARGAIAKQDSQPTRNDLLTRGGNELEPYGRLSHLAELGRKVAVEQGCVKCHSVNGDPHIGPTWFNMYGQRIALTNGQTVLVDEGYMTESIMDPAAKIHAGFNPVMPTYQNKLAGGEVAALVEYMKSLRPETRIAPEGSINAPVTGR